MAQRFEQLKQWLDGLAGLAKAQIEPATGDASFRRYFRITTDRQSYIAMDAPPEREDSAKFVRIAHAFRALGLHVPEVLAENLGQGFMLLEDLGPRLYLDDLTAENADRLYADALAALLVIQACGPREGLPVYGRDFLLREMEIFREWLLAAHLGMQLSPAESDLLDGAFSLLAASALEQPQVCVHRDYHSRNLLVTRSPSPGILDFQDAVVGPVTYDLVSLLRDCYLAWPEERVRDWARGYHQLALHSGVTREEHTERFPRWFDLMGMQRHLKASGIFARLYRRDGKIGYLKDIPRTLGYVVDVAAGYPELVGLGGFVSERVLPRLSALL
jgi:aminoglycoside/choline kinase family phosphotransferase